MWTKQEKQYFLGVLETFRDDIVRQNRDETQALIAASEHCLITRMDARFDVVYQEMKTMRTEIVHDICNFLDTAILPQLNEHRYTNRIIKQGL